MKKNNMKWCLLSLVLLCACPLLADAIPAAAAETAKTVSLKDQMLLLVMQVGIILFAAKLGGLVASFCRMPSVLGELAAGIVIGPYALGSIGFGSGIFSSGFFPLPAGSSTIPVTPELYGICTIASVILLFLSGIETNLSMFLKYAFAGSLVGIGGVVFSFLLGDLAAVYAVQIFPESWGVADVKCLAELDQLVKEGQLIKAILSPAAMLMGIMGTATSVGITARILSEKRKMDTEEGITIMAGAVIDDVLGIIVLAIGIGIIKSSSGSSDGAAAAVNWGVIGKNALQTFGVWLIGTLLGIVFARRISWLLKLFKSPLAIATLAFGLSLMIAGIFESMGMSLIIGAYVMGLSLSRTDIRYVVQENLQSIYTFLVPVFFCVMGMMVDCSAIMSKPVLIFGGAYTILAIAAKIVGCAIPSLFCGFNIIGSLRVGAGMVPRGEVALIIAGIGLSNGYLTSEAFGIGILMTLITTLVAPPALVGLFAVKRIGVRNPTQSSGDFEPFSFDMPTEASASVMLDSLIKEFRLQGFFTSLLNPAEEIWQISKDNTEITCRREREKLVFECKPEDKGFIGMAINEEVSRLNSLSHDLFRPIKTGQLESIIRDGENSERGRVGESSKYIRRFLMIPNLEANSFNEMVSLITEKMCEIGLIRDLETARAAILKRENDMSTGLNEGIAVPHGRTDAVEGLVGAVAIVRNENGIPGYDTIDHSPVRVVVLTIASDSGRTPHLQVMAYVSRLLVKNHAGLLDCTTPMQMREFLLKGEK